MSPTRRPGHRSLKCREEECGKKEWYEKKKDFLKWAKKFTKRELAQAVSIFEASSRLSSFIETSLILYFWIFPVTLIGNSFTNLMYLGIL